MLGRLLATAAIGLCFANALAADSGRPPNIIFILADDLGYGDLGCYGQKLIQTPNLDRLAAEGMRFTSCYAGSTVCAPSRCTLMTGLHTGHAFIRGNAKDALRASDLTVAELLKKAGYTNALIGKWGLGLEDSTGAPNKKGFDEFFGYLDQVHAHNYYPDFLWRNDRKHLLDKNASGRKGDYAPDWFTRAATNFVRDAYPGPFFLYLSYIIPHANNELTRETQNGMEVPSDEPYSRTDWPQPEKNKAAMITRLDDYVGKLMARLKELRMDGRTVVFFSSDNGPHKEGGNDPKFFESGGGLRGIKRDLYEGGIRVPAIVRWPGRIQPGTVSDLPWAFWDFLPTAAEIAGVKPPAGIDGISVLPTLLGQPQKQQHESLYWEFHEGGFKQAVRMGQWKAVRLAPDKPLELYDLATDQGEQENVAARHPEVVARIEASLKTARTESALWPIKDGAKKQQK